MTVLASDTATLAGAGAVPKTSLEILAEQGIYPTKAQPISAKDRYLCHCPLPGHEDHEPCFSIHADRKRWKCWTCGGATLSSLGGLWAAGLARRGRRPFLADELSRLGNEPPCRTLQRAGGRR